MPATVPTQTEFDALAARVAKLEAGTAPVPPQPGTASPDGTIVTPGTGTIHDGLGHDWTVTAGHQIARDGTADTSTSYVVRGGWYGGQIVQQNTSGDCWQTAPVWPAVWAACQSPFPPPVATAMSAATFIRNIGCDNHLGWDGTPHANADVVRASFAYLGLSLCRDAVPWSDAVAARYAQLSRAGMRWCLCVGPSGQEMTQTLPAELQRIIAMGESVVVIEGPNELNGQHVTYQGRSSADPAVGRQIQQYLANSVRALASLAGKQIANVSITIGVGGWEGYVAGLGDLSGACDLGNWHTYFAGGDQPSRNMDANRRYALQSAPNRPIIYTETGYFTATQDQSGWGGVDEATQAKNTLHILAGAAKLGIAQVYIYELLDSTANPSLTDIEARFGLFYSDGRRKPVADAVHNLTAILADTGQTTAPPLAYTLAGMPAAGNSLLLAKSTGTYELLVWNEARNWDGNNKVPIFVAPVNLTLTLPRSFARIIRYSPVDGASGAVLPAGAAATFALADKLQVIELVP